MNDWDHFRLIIAMHRAGTVRGAAGLLKINHATVSRRLAQINTKYGQPIFERVAGGYKATYLGKQLIVAAEKMENITFAVTRQTRAQGTKISGPITLSLPTALGQYLLLGELAEFCALYPDIDLKTYASYQFVNLDTSEADIVVRGTAQPPEHLVGRRLFPYAVSYYCHKNYLETTPIKDRRWIGRPDDPDNPDWIANSPYPHVKIGLKLGDIDMRHAAAVAGHGLTRGACFTADQEPKLVRLPNAKPMPFQDIWVLTHPDLERYPED